MTCRFALIAPVLPLLLLLAACQDEAPVETRDDARRTAEGEVLGGTISDAMLPLDSLRSRAPALRESAEADREGASGPASEGAAPADTPAAAPAAADDGAEAAPETDQPDEG